LAIAALAWGCRVALSPQAFYDQIELSFEHGDLNAAASDADRALLQYRANPEWLWRFRILKARVLVYQSASQEALTILQENLPSTLSSTDIAVRRSMVQGMAYRVAQDFDRSAERLVSAQDLASRNHPQLLCEVLNARAALDVSRKRYTDAEAAYSRALALAREYRRTYQEAGALVGLAWVAMSQAHFDEAVDRGQAALQLSRSLGMPGLVATALGNLGWSYFELGDFDNALEFYRQGAETSAKSGLPGYSAYWFTGVANSYIARHDYKSAEDLARSTLDRAYALKNAQATTECLNTLAEVMLRTHRLEDAKRYNEKAQKIEDSGGDTFGVPDSLILAGHIAAAEMRFGDADQFFHRVLSGPSPDAPLRWQAEAGLAGVRDGEKKPMEAERLYLQAIDTIEKARHSIDHDELRLSFLSSGIAVYGEYIDFLVRHGRSADALHQAELSRARTLGEGLSSTAKATSRTIPSVQPQQLALRLHGTLLVYWLGEEHSYLWAITPTKTIHLALPPASEIDPLVKAYRGAIVNSRDVLATEERLIGEKLYTMLIAPAQKLIPANSRVILLPDGSLYGLNFETLIAPQSKPHYWIEDVTLTTASSLTMLAAAANRPPAKEKNLLLVGNTKEANAAFPPLSQSAVEMNRIEQYFPEPRRAVLEGVRATPSAYLSSNPERFSYVHFVTHGTASRARPLESAVILSPEGGSYKLYARDIVTRHLRAELVTISACYGSGSRAYSGEGLVGLSWAFLRAGAHNVIGALWEVADAPATPELMDGLYKELNQGRDTATALRSAKLNLLHSGNVFAKPFYWAPFQLYAGS
jgi:CHAT domain-containing protein/tetratricopeptide (TPR) repeat protein